MLDLKTIEIHAWNSYSYFKDCFTGARREYALYGDKALEIHFDKEARQKYGDIFTKSSNSEEFYDNLRAAWEKEYHHVANSYKDLVTLYEFAEENGVSRAFDDLLPDTDKGRRSGEATGVDEPFAITEELYYYILKKVQWDTEEPDSSKEYIIDDATGNLYCLYMSERNLCNYQYVRMEKLHLQK